MTLGHLGKRCGIRATVSGNQQRFPETNVPLLAAREGLVLDGPSYGDFWAD